MTRLFKWISLHNKKQIVITFAIAALLSYISMGTYFFGMINNFDKNLMLDMQFFYTGNDFIAALNNLNPLEVNSYLYMHLIDYVFIFTFYPTLTFLFDFINKHQSNIVLLPILAMLFDLFENLIIDMQLLTSIPKFLGSIAGIFTILKFSTLIISGILILVNIYLNRRRKTDA
jgi:hypothetical protein